MATHHQISGSADREKLGEDRHGEPKVIVPRRTEFRLGMRERGRLQSVCQVDRWEACGARESVEEGGHHLAFASG